MPQEDAMSSVNDIYNLRSNFIVIGLTGFTGNGCTTVANILQSSFKELNLPKISIGGLKEVNNQLRKDEIIYNYVSETWTSFKIIRAVDVLTSFLLSLDKDNFLHVIACPQRQNDIPYDEFAEKNRAFLETIKNPNPELLSRNLNFLENELPSFRNKLKTILPEDTFTSVYQKIGNNIRKTGSPLESTIQTAESIFTLAKRINDIIKLYRNNSRDKHTKTRLVIDALRNPYELLYLQERYTAFYLFAVHSSDEDRKMRLENTRRTVVQIDELYNTEAPLKPGFLTQNIPECFQKADVHIVNDNNDNQHFDLKKQLMKYISLIERPGIIQPSADERLMQMATIAKLNSGCISRQVGAVVVNKYNQVVGVGWNSSPNGQTCCNLRSVQNLLQGIDPDSYSDYERENKTFQKQLTDLSVKDKTVLAGRNEAFCFKKVYNEIKHDSNQVHTRSLHAEENAFLQISKFGGMGVCEGTLYTTASPCELCAKKAYHLGIKRIVYIDKYPGISIEHILNSGTHHIAFDFFRGANGRAFQKLFMPFIPLKDELNYFV